MKRNGLTLMELLTVISILATLAALLYPVYTQVRKRVYVTRCAAQMKQLGVAFRMYAHDYGDDSPYSIPYAEKLYPHYISDERVLVCPCSPSSLSTKFGLTLSGSFSVKPSPWLSASSHFTASPSATLKTRRLQRLYPSAPYFIPPS